MVKTKQPVNRSNLMLPTLSYEQSLEDLHPPQSHSYLEDNYEPDIIIKTKKRMSQPILRHPILNNDLI